MVYAPLDEPALVHLAKGLKPDNVIAFPSGFAIIPGGLPKDNGNNAGSNESLLTISFNLIDKATHVSRVPPESVETIYRIITETVTAIKDVINSLNLFSIVLALYSLYSIGYALLFLHL